MLMMEEKKGRRLDGALPSNKQMWTRQRAGLPQGQDKTEDSIAQLHKGVSRAGETTQDLNDGGGDVYSGSSQGMAVQPWASHPPSPHGWRF